MYYLTMLAQAAAEATNNLPMGKFSLYQNILFYGLIMANYISPALKIFCIVHLIKNRHNYLWCFVILIIPYCGALTYLCTVVLPEICKYDNISNFQEYKKQLTQLKLELTLEDTVATRSKIAKIYLLLRDFQQARDFFLTCQQGAYKDDPFFYYGLARANYELGNFQDALNEINATMKDSYTDYLNERTLLKAKILDAMNMNQQALELYTSIANNISTQEALCRQAILLEKMGQTEDAKQIFSQISRNAQSMDKDAKKRENEWITLAKKHLKRLTK